MTKPEPPRSPYRFEVGQIVHHRRYGYRGAIFDRDPVFGGDDAWYWKNQTQPDKNQPWYHVLVDGALHTTYVAQGNLEPVDDPAPITHPATDEYFSTFLDGRYLCTPQS